MDLKQVWEKKINETKAVDNNAREPEPVAVTKANRANNSASNSHSSRNSNKEQTQQLQQQSQQTTPHVSQHVTQVSASQIQSSNNHQVSGGLPQVHLQTGANIVLGPSGINYTTNNEQVFIRTVSLIF